MDTDTPKPLLTADMEEYRSKAQVWMDEWGVTDIDSAREAKMKRRRESDPPIELWTTLKLPYQAPSSPPLLSWDELKPFSQNRRNQKPLTEQREAGLEFERLHENAGMHQVYRFGDYVVKWSGNPKLIEEAENILFLTEHRPQLHIPTLIAAWVLKNDSNHTLYCTMTNYINGVRLNGLTQFASMKEQAQDIICAKISAQLAYLHSLPLPSEQWYYGRIYRQGWARPPESIRKGPKMPITGPFSSYGEFVATIERVYEINDAVSFSLPEWDPMELELRRQLVDTLKDWRPNEPRLTWLDPKFKNMIAVPIGGDAETATDWDVFFVDWEDLGWYPAWVQGAQVIGRGGANVRTSEGKYGGSKCYREEVIMPRLLKDFAPEFDMERKARVLECSWRFF